MAETVKKAVAEATLKGRRESRVKVKIFQDMLEILAWQFH
jgi:hypothetical protein